MKLWRVAIILFSCLVLAGCFATYKSQQRIGTYSYNGKNYDLYRAVVYYDDAIPREENVRFIVKSGDAPPEHPGSRRLISTCKIKYNESESSRRKRCDKKFSGTLSVRDKPEETESSSDY